MFFIVAATISGGLTAVAWTLHFGLGWAVVFGLLTAAVSGAQAALILGAIERREERDEAAPAAPAALPHRPGDAADVTVPHSLRAEP
ncbi:hypothetical protein VQ03_00880 [Methylobacterium tarhaniae]|uniref:Uncharacterized protein n=1 Tax=Methylobacterium tarhaniae TaxID=1187852 RepID=A0A0J6W004_9HYPH|nr:hypothetical protein [Methylobacterium tarhaniae]KMO44886.1 hypothetical protein VQ03_00880 [Methylobacterium tarhaniae]